jgi:hypothetical protein
LAQAERVGQDRTAAANRWNAEVATLREALAQTEREGRRRAAAAAALQAEIVALQDTLAAARQVGHAAIVAFRIDTAASQKPERARGWRQLIMRFFPRRDEFLNRASKAGPAI